MNTPPEPPAESVWSRGSRTVTQAMAETGLSRNELFALMDVGVIPWFNHGGRGAMGRRLLAWGPLCDLLERWHERHLAAGTGARTSAKAATKSAPEKKGKKS